jgi:hypothetical protein
VGSNPTLPAIFFTVKWRKSPLSHHPVPSRRGLKLHLTISKTQTPGPPQASFIVRVGPLTLTSPEQAWWQRYGAEPLETLFLAHGGITAIQTANGITVSFTDAALAQHFVNSAHAACMSTEAYWQAADGFHGNDDYETP